MTRAWSVALAMAAVATVLLLAGCAAESADDDSATDAGNQDVAASAAQDAVFLVTVVSSHTATDTSGAVGAAETWDRSLWGLAEDGATAEPIESYPPSQSWSVPPPALSLDGGLVAFSGETTGTPELNATVWSGLHMLDLENAASEELTSAAVLDFGWDDDALVVIAENGPPRELPSGAAYESSPRILRWTQEGGFDELADIERLRSAGVTYSPSYLGSDGGVLYFLDGPLEESWLHVAGGGTVWRMTTDGDLTRVAPLASARTGAGASDGATWQTVLGNRSRTALAEGLLPIETGALRVTPVDGVGTMMTTDPERTIEVFRAENLNLVRSMTADYPTDATLPSQPVFDATVTRYLAIEERMSDEVDSRTCWIVETDGESGERTEIVPVPCPGNELPWVSVVGYAGDSGDFLYMTQEGTPDRPGLARAIVTRHDRSEGVTATVLELESDPGETWSSIDVLILGP